MWIKIKYCIMLNNAEDIILNITDILTLPWPGHLNLALTNIEVARLCGFDQNSVNHPGILLMAHSAQFFTLDEVNPCCRPAPDNADGRAAPGYLRSSVPASSVALP